MKVGETALSAPPRTAAKAAAFGFEAKCEAPDCPGKTHFPNAAWPAEEKASSKKGVAKNVRPVIVISQQR